MNETVRTDWPDIWYSAFYEADGDYSVKFRIHGWNGACFDAEGGEVPCFEEDEKPQLVGHVKWDGCNEWDTADGVLHFCYKDGAQKLGQAVERCCDMAAGILNTKQRLNP